MNKMKIAKSKRYFLPSIFRNREKITLVLGRGSYGLTFYLYLKKMDT